MSLAELVDHVIGVDPDRDRITAAVVCARTQGEIASKSFATTARGYGQAMRWAKDHTTDGRRAWSIESTGSYGAGLVPIQSKNWSAVPTTDGAVSGSVFPAQRQHKGFLMEVFARQGIRLQRPHDAAVTDVIGEQMKMIDGVGYKNASVITYGGAKYIFSHRAILTIVVMAACNAACKFCSNEITFTPGGRYVTFGDKLARAKDFALLAGVTKVAFTGGEPTLHPQKLADLTREVIPGFRRARLHTNGSRLFEPVQTHDGERLLIDALRSNGLTGTSISVAHWDSDLNQEVMRWKAGWEGIDDGHLARIASYDDEGFSSRLSCVMTGESIAGPEDMLSYMQWGRELGFRRFIFRTCSQIPDGFQKPTDFASYNTANAQSVDELAQFFDLDKRFELTYRQRKTDSKVDVYRWGDMTFDVDESSEEVDPDPKIRRLNYMPDRVTYTSWIDSLATLFEDDRDVARRSTLVEVPLLLDRLRKPE